MSINKYGQVESSSINTAAYQQLVESVKDVRLIDTSKPYSHTNVSQKQEKRLLSKRWRVARTIRALQSTEAFLSFLLSRSLQRHNKLWKMEPPAKLTDVLELYHRQDGRCAISLIKMVCDHNKPNSISIDRIDSSHGYTKDNIQLLALFVNIGKSAYNNQDMIDIFNEVRTTKNI
jgi:hypothetical protein